MYCYEKLYECQLTRTEIENRKEEQLKTLNYFVAKLAKDVDEIKMRMDEHFPPKEVSRYIVIITSLITKLNESLQHRHVLAALATTCKKDKGYLKLHM